MPDWGLFVAIASMAIAAFTLFSRTLDKNLSIREHEEFKNRKDREIDQFRAQCSRELTELIAQYRIDLNRLERRIHDLDQTKPTTGELDRAAKAIESRLEVMEERIKTINHRRNEEN